VEDDAGASGADDLVREGQVSQAGREQSKSDMVSSTERVADSLMRAATLSIWGFGPGVTAASHVQHAAICIQCVMVQDP
jgi:hypothetical protein